MLSVAGFLGTLDLFPVGKAVYSEGKEASFLPVLPSDVQPRCQKCKTVTPTRVQTGTVVHTLCLRLATRLKPCVNKAGGRRVYHGV